MSAGSVNTPHILLNSGIGDNNTLSSLDITTFHHLPDVGKNMTDTAVMYISWEVDSDQTFDVLLNNLTAREEAFAQWNATKTGRMANGLFNLAGQLRMNHSNPEVQEILQEFGDATAGRTAANFEMLFIVSCFTHISYIHISYQLIFIAGRRPRRRRAKFLERKLGRKLFQHAPRCCRPFVA